jgi:tripartite-type tricarboxylate transporter receptor subunit TctC
MVARVLAPAIGAALGQSVIVDNRGGAGGNVGAAAAARSAPDGYTFFLGNIATHGINPALYPQLPFDPLRDFDAVGMTHFSAQVIVVNPAFEARSLSALIALAMAQPGRIHYATGGNGTSAHAAGELLKTAAGINLIHVPYRGSAPAIADVIGGSVPVMVDNIISSRTHIQDGRLRALAITTALRSPFLPDVPTTVELGLPTVQATSWMGLFMPKGTPAQAIDGLNRALNAALGQAPVREGLTRIAAEPGGGTAAQLDEHVRAELAKWARVVREANMTVD